MDTISDNLKYDLSNYFNGDLKNSLKFKEGYRFATYKDGTIFFQSVPNGSKGLYNILISNPKITSQLKQTLVTFLSSDISDLKDVKLAFDDKGFGIVLERNPLELLNVVPYVNIASNLKTVDELNSFCSSSRKTANVCGTEEFWRSLLKMVYPKKYKGVYNYKSIYKEYLRLKPILDEDMIQLTDILSNDTRDYINFVFNEGFVPVQEYQKFIKAAIDLGMDSVVNIILQSPDIDTKVVREYILGALTEALEEDYLEYISQLFRIVAYGNKFIDLSVMITPITENLWSDPVIDLVRSLIREGQYKDLFGDTMLRFAMSSGDENKVKYLLETIRYPRDVIVNILRGAEADEIPISGTITDILLKYIQR